MDYNKFEDRISSWIEGDLDLKDRKEFEAFLAENPEYQSKVDEVRNIISRMRESDSLKLSEEFDKKLAEKIDSLNVGVTDKKSNDIFGFSRQNFAYLTLSLGAILFLIFQFPANSFDENIINNSRLISEENLKTVPVDGDSLDSEDKENNNYNINGTFVNDKK